MNEGATSGLDKLESAGYADSSSSTALPATASLGDSAAGSFNQRSAGLPVLLHSVSRGYADSEAAIYPRVVTAMDIIEDSDSDSIFCGPASDTEQSGLSELRALHAWGIGVQEEEGHRRRRRGGEEAKARREGTEGGGEGGGGGGRRGPPPLVQPRGEVEGENQKYICVFQIGLEDDEEFCLVKRILGKAGNNMRRIADDCNAKVRLRGIGSGFLEGADGREANMPLQLNVSCVDYKEYITAIDQVATLLKDLYKHYRRYARSKGMEPPDVKIALEEVRRDDLGFDQLSAKANRTPSQRERDRRAREQERRLHRERERDKQAAKAAAAQALIDGTLSAATVTASARARYQSRERISQAENKRDKQHDSGSGEDEIDDEYSYLDEELKQKPVPKLPSGMPVPTTAAGRRAAARTGGAAAAAIASAAARELEREERERQRAERDKKRRDAEDRAAAVAKRPGRNAPRGSGIVTRGTGDAQQFQDGIVPIGAAVAPVGAQPSAKGSGKGKGKQDKSSKNKGGDAEAGLEAQTLAGAPPPPPPGPPPEDALMAGPVPAGASLAAAAAGGIKSAGRRRRV